MHHADLKYILPVVCLIIAAATLMACSSANLPYARGVRSSMRSRTSAAPGSRIPLSPNGGTGYEARQDPGAEQSSNVRTRQPQTSLDALRRGQSAVTSERNPLQDIYFGFNSFDLSRDARATLEAAADWLQDHPAVRVESRATAMRGAPASTTCPRRQAGVCRQRLSGDSRRCRVPAFHHKLWRRNSSVP
jgi:hypothetical protein